MVLSKKRSKFLSIVVLSALLISANNSKAVADSRIPLNINRQSQFLEDRRIIQNMILGQRQKNTTVEGMMTSKDIENRRKADIEEKIRLEKIEEDSLELIEETDTYSEMVKSIRKRQRRRAESKEAVHKKTINQTSRGNRYYKNTNIPIVKHTVRRAERIPLSESSVNAISGNKEEASSNPLLGQLEVIKDLIDKPLPDSDPINMSDSDIGMLERIVMAESGGEPYLGQVAVANVVLNRVKSNRYPSTLEGVIFQRSQFSPVKNGVIRGRTPNASVKKAVAQALGGRMIVPSDTLYFVNPVLATDQTVPRTKTPVKVIGSHTFYK